ncbi:MAG: translation initiation factor IF-2 [Tissierellia bacterium]|nr:translation initiation factor IF-2 [Tissierellia bacterium]
MKKMRIYELAKELGISTKELMTKLGDMKMDYTSHMSIIKGEDMDKVRAEYNQSTPEKRRKKPTDQQKNGGSKQKKSTKKQQKKEESKKKSSKHHRRNKKQEEKKERPTKKKKERKKEEKPVEISETIMVKDFADRIKIPVNQVITKLISYGVMANQNQEIDFDTALLISDEFGKKIIKEEVEDFEDADVFNLDFEDPEEDLKPRPPVVTIMGHVDHGKTSILDNIRKSHVRQGEAGGITQHIGAYTARVDDKKIIFLDTPGHEAFTSMRARGAQVTDIAILVVAADDGVMPQTLEAIAHAKAAEVPIIVAVNKMDRPDANLERIKQELAENGLMPDDWGGDAIVVPVSALKGEGIDELLEMILMVAEMEELKANPNRHAVGTVVEAQLDKGRGPTATVLIQKGTLHQGDEVFSGQASGRVRAIFNDNGKTIKKAGPSTPVLILGLSEVPEAGDMLYAVDSEKTAREYAEKIKDHNREESLSMNHVSLDDLFDRIDQGELKELNIIIKTDVRGTIDAVSKSFEKLSNDEVKVKIIHGAVGGVTESDVMLAMASQAIIIGFNVRPTQGAIDLAKQESVEIRTYRVIYEAIEDLKSAIEGMLEPDLVEEVQGRAEVRDLFKIPSVGTIAGVRVTSGKITRNSTIRLLRNNIVIFEGPVSSLKRFKDDVRELAQGYEGGIGLENFNDIKEGDIAEAYIMKEVKRTL